MGQVWSKADFDGTDSSTARGGRGSVLAVTTQNAGADGILGTGDDIYAPMNPLTEGVQISMDRSPGANCSDANDRVREFASLHSGGANFLFADGSVRFLQEGIGRRTYQTLSTIASGEVVPGEY